MMLGIFRSGIRLRALREDRSGAALMEFGLVAPVFLFLLLALFDLGQWMYARSVLDGAVQTAARTSALESGDTVQADAHVSSMIKRITPDANVVASRVSYYDFADLDRAEKWNDEDNSGDCNDGEAFTDENGNGTWDADIGVSGNGGAGDVVIYTVGVTYEPSFAMPLLPHVGDTRKLTSTAIKKNQPFATQTGYTAEAGTCD